MDKWEQGWDAVRGRVGLTDWDFSRRKEKPRPEFLALPRASFFFARPFCLSHSCIQLMPLHWRVDFYNLRIFAGQQYLNQHDVLSLRSNGYITSSSYQKSRLDLELLYLSRKKDICKKSFQIQHLSMFSFNWLFMESFLVRKKQTGISCLAFYSWTLCTNRQRATIWAE